MNLVNVLADAVTCNGVSIPGGVVGIIRAIIFVIQVVVPILLIIWGMLDFAKAIIQQDEDKIKAGQKTFIQRLIAAVIVFLIVTVVKLMITAVGNVTGSDSQADTAWDCAKRIIGTN